jgi:hypothetical protein
MLPICLLYTLLCWHISLLFLISLIFFCHDWMLNFLKACIYSDDYDIFILDFVYVPCFVYYFAYVEPCLHSWNEPNLIMLYELFWCVVFGLQVLRIFALMFTKETHLCFSFFFFFVVSLYDFGIRIMLAS